jgi:hypothetical protein
MQRPRRVLVTPPRGLTQNMRLVMSQAVFSNSTRALSVIGECLAALSLVIGGAVLTALATLL